MWFLITYPLLPTGITNKVTYMIQIFMVLPVLAGLALEKLKTARPLFYNLAMLGLLLVFAHNLPALITRYPWWLLLIK